MVWYFLVKKAYKELPISFEIIHEKLLVQVFEERSFLCVQLFDSPSLLTYILPSRACLPSGGQPWGPLSQRQLQKHRFPLLRRLASHSWATMWMSIRLLLASQVDGCHEKPRPTPCLARCGRLIALWLSRLLPLISMVNYKPLINNL